MIDNRSLKSRFRITVTYFIVIALGVLCFFPLWNILCISFSGSTAIVANKVTVWPVDFNIKAYEMLIGDAQFWRSFRISVLRVVLALCINMVLIVTLAYPLSKTKQEFTARNIYMYLLIFAMVFYGGMIPTYLVVKELHLLNTVWALVLPGAVPAFSVIMVMNFFIGIPKSLEEAATIDGGNPWQIMLKIYIPCSKPVMATVALFSIVGNWNDFFNGLIYNTKIENYPLMSYVQSKVIDINEMIQSGASSDQLAEALQISSKSLNAAKIVVSVIPLLMIYPLLQKYLITGMVMGAVKE